MEPQWMELNVRGDARGQLVAIEGERTVPFRLARVYYVFGTLPGVRRGAHAHRQLQQLVVAVRGGCDMVLDDGREQGRVRVDDPGRGLFLPPLLWHEMENFSADCVLLVLADAPYDERDYLRNHDEFLQYVRASHR